MRDQLSFTIDSLTIFLLYILDEQGNFDPDEPAIVHHMICTSLTATRYVSH